MQGASLVSTQNRVEVPFIIAKIGKYTFGHCQRSDRAKLNSVFNITYPNYMDSLTITKVNGTVNTYVLNMVYNISEQDDPNMLEKVFSSVSNSREITLSYGDWNMPSFIYKEEKCIITKVQTKVNMAASNITYVVQCTSNAVAAQGICDTFPAKFARPSDIIMSLISSERYGLQDIFPGMRNRSAVDLRNFIDRNDRKVLLESKKCNILDYISYLVSCMVSKNDNPLSPLKSECFFWAVYDDINNEYGGSYFKVERVAANTRSISSFNTYEVDVGYPGGTYVLDFTVNNDDSWSLLYDYGTRINVPQYSYYIDDKGEIVKERSAALTESSKYFTTTEADRNWWSLVTQFPITATLTIKGLLRPAMLMSYVKVNTYFYGHKHTSSGLYIITKQQDLINSQGYRTTLSLTRIGGDEQYV